MKQKRKKPLITDWAYKEGVFLSPNGKWIVRVRDGSNLKTISQHETKEQAECAYNGFYNAT
jgi:hypothetical protein